MDRLTTIYLFKEGGGEVEEEREERENQRPAIVLVS